MIKSALGAMGALLLGMAPLSATEPDAAIPTVEVLPLSFAQSGVSGPGGERIKAELVDAQFVALGEDHGFADSPMLAQALAADMQRLGMPVYHAAEIGPLSADWLHRHFSGNSTLAGLKIVAAGLRGKGLAMPFTSNVEDATLAAGFFDAEGTSRLWGIDQEFMGAPMILLEGLATRTHDKAARSKLMGITEADRIALSKLEFDNAWLAKAKTEDFADLSKTFADDPEALKLIEAFAVSAKIYQLNNSGSYAASNESPQRLDAGIFSGKLSKGRSRAQGSFENGRLSSRSRNHAGRDIRSGIAIAGSCRCKWEKVAPHRLHSDCRVCPVHCPVGKPSDSGQAI